jgi:hypothetical protein
LVDLAVSFSLYFPHTTAYMFLNITYLISHRKCVTTIQDSIAWLINTHYISSWQNGDWQTFAKGLQTVHEGFVLFVFWFVVNRHRLPHFLRRFSPLQSESPEQTALIFAVFPRPSKSFNICQRCCLTNWAIAYIWQDAFDMERMSTTWQQRKTFQVD